MSDYWQERADRRMKEIHADIERRIAQIIGSYERALIEIDNQIERLAYKGKIELEDLEELLSVKVSKEEVDTLYSLLDSVKGKAAKRKIKEEITKLAYKARISRLEVLKANVNARIALLTDRVEHRIETGLKVASESMYNMSVFDFQQQIGYAFAFETPTDQMINEIIRSSWSGKNWSERLWDNTDQLSDDLIETMTTGFAQGKSYRLMTLDLKERLQTDEYKAVRLIRTEASYVANQAKLLALSNSGVDEFEYVAVLDAKTSEICQDRDGSIVKLKDAEIGINLPPLHPNCRSTFVAKLSDEFRKNLKRSAVNPVTGERESIPRDMTYKEWKQTLYDRYGVEKTDVAFKKVKNLKRDNSKFQEYGQVVRNFPSTLGEFQDMKYTDVDRWNQFKREYDLISDIRNKHPDWPDSHREKLISTYYKFRDEGIEVSDHGLDRFVNQKKGPTKKLMTFEDVVTVWRQTPNYWQIVDGELRDIKFYNGIGIPYVRKTGKVITFLSTNKPGGEWIPNGFLGIPEKDTRND